MSTILNALRKVQRDRREKVEPAEDLQQALVQEPLFLERSRHLTWIAVGLIVFLTLSAGAFALIYLNGDSAEIEQASLAEPLTQKAPAAQPPRRPPSDVASGEPPVLRGVAPRNPVSRPDPAPVAQTARPQPTEPLAMTGSPEAEPKAKPAPPKPAAGPLVAKRAASSPAPANGRPRNVSIPSDQMSRRPLRLSPSITS